MKKCLLILLVYFLILSASGCAVKGNAHSEFVEDRIEISQRPAYFLGTYVPKEMLLEAISEDRSSKVYVHKDGDYEMIIDVFSANTLDTALSKVTGREKNSLQFLSLDHYPIDEYRYAWSALSEQGEQTCCGSLFYDGTHYYALSIHCVAEKEKEYRELFSHILETASLQANETP